MQHIYDFEIFIIITKHIVLRCFESDNINYCTCINLDIFGKYKRGKYFRMFGLAMIKKCISYNFNMSSIHQANISPNTRQEPAVQMQCLQYKII